MNKKYVIAILSLCVASAMFFGCGKETAVQDTQTEVVEETTEIEYQEEASGNQDVADVTMGNPWEESDVDDIKQSLGFDINIPEGATDVVFQKNMTIGMAEMTFKLPDYDYEFNYRMQETEEAEDISGLYYEWENFDERTIASVTYKEGRATEDGITYDLITMYDSDSKISYSISTSAEDLDGFDLLAVADMVYDPTRE